MQRRKTKILFHHQLNVPRAPDLTPVDTIHRLEQKHPAQICLDDPTASPQGTAT